MLGKNLAAKKIKWWEADRLSIEDGVTRVPHKVYKEPKLTQNINKHSI